MLKDVEVKYVEVSDPIDQLSPDERQLLDRAFGSSGDREFPRWRDVKAALPLLRKIEPVPFLLEPPRNSDWRVWYLKIHDGWTYDALAAKGSPVERTLGGRTRDSRRRSAIRAVHRVKRFREKAEPWWFDLVKRLVVTD
jgi:hypothetical protein